MCTPEICCKTLGQEDGRAGGAGCLPFAAITQISYSLSLLSTFFQSSYWGKGTEITRDISTLLPSCHLPHHWQRQARTSVHFQTLKRGKYISVGIKPAVLHAPGFGDTFLQWKDVRDTSSALHPEPGTHVQRRCRTPPPFSILVNFVASFSLMLCCTHKIQL